ncbi:MAG: hypothetical protein ACKVON_06920 [Beijerinckiaceae bacterium]
MDNHDSAALLNQEGLSNTGLAKSRLRRKRRWPQRIAVWMGSALFTPVILIAGFFAYLARGPVELPFLTERVASALEEQFGSGVDVQVGRTLLERTGEGIAFHIQDVQINNAEGKTILRSPDALISFDPIRLLALSVVPKSLSFKGMAIRGLVTPEGNIAFTADDERKSPANPGAESEFQTQLSSALGGLALLARKGVTGDLSAVSIEDASLVIDDRRNGNILSFDRFRLRLDRQENGTTRVAGSLSRGGDTVPYVLMASASQTRYTFNLETANITDSFIAAISAHNLPVSITGRLNGSAEVTTDLEGKPLSVIGKAQISAGSILLKAPGQGGLDLEQGSLLLRWNGDAERIDELTVAAKAANFTASMSGPVSLPSPGNPWYRFNGQTTGWTLAGITPKDPAATVDTAVLTVAVSDDLTVLNVEDAVFKGTGTDFSLKATVQNEKDGPSLRINVLAGPMPARAALRWWPPFLSSETRNFFVDSVRGGQMARFSGNFNFPPALLKAAMALQPLPADAFKIEVGVADISAVITPDLPLLSGLTGTATVNGIEALGSGIAANLDVRGGRRMPLLDGSFAITGLNTAIPKALFQFRNQSSLELVAELLKTPVLKNALGIDVDLASLKGQFDGRASIALPLSATLKASDITSVIDARMTSVSIDNAIGKDKLENASLTVKSVKQGLEVKGEGRWQNLPVSLELQNDTEDKSTSTNLSFILDEAALKKRGINLGQRLTGPLPVKISTLREQGENLTAKVEVDLTKAVINGLLPGFQKPAARAGKLTFDATEKAAGYSIQNLVMESGASSFKGTAEALADGTITSARLSLFRLSPGDNVRLDFDRQANGQKIVIRGNNFDARPFLKKAFGPDDVSNGASAAEKNLDIELKTTLLSGFGGEVMTNVDLKTVRKDDQLRQLALTAKLNGKDIKLSGRSAGEGPASVTVDVDDAGAFLRYIDIYTRMVGGQLDGQIAPAGKRTNGVFLVRDFALRDEPALRRLVQEAPADAVLRSNANDARFSKMRIDFSREGTQTTVKDAVIFGPQIGISFNGVLDQERDRISMSGTYVPVYGLNNAFSQIPLFGNLLAGSRNEGLLGVTFGVSGRFSRPVISINPLSAVTPGIFRKIFEFRNDRTDGIPPAAYSPSNAGQN